MFSDPMVQVQLINMPFVSIDSPIQGAASRKYAKGDKGGRHSADTSKHRVEEVHQKFVMNFPPPSDEAIPKEIVIAKGFGGPVPLSEDIMSLLEALVIILLEGVEVARM